jgi:hypothetical protein
MSPIRKNSDGNIELSPGFAGVLTLLFTLATLVFATGARWTSNEDALAQERHDRIAADSALRAELGPIARNVTAIKNHILGCANDALCQP